MSTCPARFVCYTLRCTFTAHFTCFRVEIHYMICAEVFAIVVLQSLVCMADGNVPEGRICSHAADLEEQFEVHHIVNDDRTFPSLLGLPSLCSHVPRLYDASSRTKACRERSGCIYQDCVVAGNLFEPESVTITVVDHESYIMMRCKILDVMKYLCMLLSLLCIVFVSCEFIHVPERTGKESADPVFGRYKNNLSVLECGWNSQGAV